MKRGPKSKRAILRTLAALKAHETMRSRRIVFDPDKHSLVDYVRISGGLKMTGDLGDVLDDPIAKMLLVRPDGADLDLLYEQAWREAGFIGPGIAHDSFVDALARDLHAKRQGDGKRRVWSLWREKWDDCWWKGGE